MTIRILSSKTHSFLHQFQFFKDSKHIGHCRTVIDKQGAILSDLEIYDQYKKQGFGSHFLRNTEQKLKSEFDVQEVSLLVGNHVADSKLSTFSKKMDMNLFLKTLLLMMILLLFTTYIDFIKNYNMLLVISYYNSQYTEHCPSFSKHAFI